MNDKISFYLLSYSGNTVKQFALTRRRLGIVLTCSLILLMITAGIFFDYFNLKITFDKKEIEKTISNQSNEILSQRKQIQEFANEINVLKSNLVRLNKFEKKIRIIANINNPSEKDNLFGVGGSIPEDLDPKLPLAEKHNSLMREMHEQARELSLASVSQEKVFESLINDLKRKRNLLSSTPSIWPAKGWLSSGFGYRISPFTGLREFHKGFDISSRKGTKVIATADGVVTFAGRNGLYGNMIKIDHGHGMMTRYGHLEKMLKKRGDAVKRGDVIGLMGNTGRSTGPHVHYEVFLNGLPVNPQKYILN
ncbi:MAG: M23 family metallopeptidase [Desulfobacterales bacterium]|nr:M23 family metallopeptidase [Desulfobacterales bacterium]